MGLFHIVFYQPLYNALIFLYGILPFADIGFAIIALTILIKGILFPLTFKSLKAQKDMQELQPKIQEIKEKYKDDRQKMSMELMEVYKEHKVNPFASCLPLLIQLPIFWALFRVLQRGVEQVDAALLYNFVQAPDAIGTMFFGIIDLAKISIPLAILAAAAQYLQAKQTIAKRPIKEVRKKDGAKDEDMMAQMNKMMLYFIPVMTLLIGATSLPGGVMLYWLSTTFITVLLYKIFLPKKKEEK